MLPAPDGVDESKATSVTGVPVVDSASGSAGAMFPPVELGPVTVAVMPVLATVSE